MAKEKSQAQSVMDEIQASVRPFLKDLGFQARSRAFNHRTSDGLTQVIEFQMGRNHYGKFTVNVGVYVPELYAYTFPDKKLSFIHEYDCWIRARLGQVGPEGRDIWWELSAIPEQAADVFHRIERDALPFLARYETRENVIREWVTQLSTRGSIEFVLFSRSRQQFACAIMLAKQGRHEEARSCALAALEHDPDHRCSAGIRAFLQELELQS